MTAQITPAPTDTECADRISAVTPVSKPAVLIPWLIGLLTAAIYTPVTLQSAERWLSQEQYSHGLCIFPIVAALLFWKRKAIRVAPRSPSLLGAVPLVFGLTLQVCCHAFRLPFPEMLSLLPTISGLALLLHGPALWRVVRFPVLFLGFAGNLPGFVLDRLSAWVQRASADGAAFVVKCAGLALVQHGNQLFVPGMSLEVADVCSGFRKLTALIVAAVLYGYVFPASPLRRAALVLLVVPIALLANIFRLCVLILAASWGGPVWEGRLHNPAELSVLIVSLVLMIAAARLLGWERSRPGEEGAESTEQSSAPAPLRPLDRAGRTRWLAGAACVALLLTTLGMDRLVGNGGLREQYRPDAAAFPRQVGPWRSGPDRPIAEMTHRMLPSASMIDRVYTDPEGRTVNLVLVSATSVADVHDPDLCFPGHGWTLEHIDTTFVGDRTVRRDRAVQEGHALSLLYWWEVPTCRGESWLDTFEKTRLTLWGRGTILVRLTMPDRPGNEAALDGFARELTPALAAWKRAGPPDRRPVAIRAM